MKLKHLSMCSLVCLICAVFTSSGYADQIKFARYPHLCNGKMAFTYHGDIWVVNEDGSHPYRLTDHVAMDVFPRFSPDGQTIAFSSDRLGNYDLWIIPVMGGEAKQLTFHTTDDWMNYWTPDGKRLIFRTGRQGTFNSPLYTVDLEGGLPIPMDMDMGSAGMISQDGTELAFNRLGFRYWRKHYKGNNNTDIWVQDLGTKAIRQLTDLDTTKFRTHTQDAFPMWGSDGKLYFMSEKDDIFNIWSILSEGGGLEQKTFHKKDGIQYPSISPDGKTIVYENEFELWRYDIDNSENEPKKISISMDFDSKENLIEFIQVDSQADNFTPSSDGRYVAVDNHGEIFIVPADPEEGEKTQVTSSPWRDGIQSYSPDGKYLSYVSDESGDWEIWLYDLQSGKIKQLTDNGNTKSGVHWSADSQKLAWTASNKLFISDVESGQTEELAYNQARGYRPMGWSSNGQWIVYSRSDDDSNDDLYLFNILDKKEYNLTQNPFRERDGYLTSDNKFLVFTSTRDSGVSHLFVLSLDRLVEDPDDPIVKERLKQDELKKDKTENSADLSLKLNMEGIDRRAVQITRGEAGVGSFFLSKDGKKIYFSSQDNQGPGLFVIDLDGKNRKNLKEGTFRNLEMTSDGKSFLFSRDNSIFLMPVAGLKEKKVSFEFSVNVDKKKEWEQIFEESWRVMKYYFYDEKMHGYDWDAIKEAYKPFLRNVGNNQDLYDLTNEMIGELNASHTGVSGPTRERPETYRSKFLGFEMEPGDPYYRISHVYWNGPADKEWINLKKGDYVFAIDGIELKSGDNYWNVLNHTLNDYVSIRVNSTASPEDAREVRIKAVTSLRNIKYEEWVKRNRDYVEELTNGEIAYVHIRSMNQSSLRIFENEINQFHNRKGIVVDIRYNGGGNTDQQLLDILERRPYEYWNNRWGSRPMGRRPRQAIAGPKVILINWRSASDSEVTPMGFRDLGLGRIVGNPTYGAVIATGSYGLINGGSIRRPGSLVVTYDPSKPNNYGINLENYGVAPDVWAENSPDDELKGFDRELKAAVDEVLRMLKEKK
ncbi:S41 family peptidase [Acidobacteriota bacterium]